MQPKYGAPMWASLSNTPYLFQPFSITSFALALLITFRTNSCYARCADQPISPSLGHLTAAVSVQSFNAVSGECLLEVCVPHAIASVCNAG